MQIVPSSFNCPNWNDNEIFKTGSNVKMHSKCLEREQMCPSVEAAIWKYEEIEHWSRVDAPAWVSKTQTHAWKQMWNLVISLPGNFHFWRGNVPFSIFLFLFLQQILKFVNNSHFWRNFYHIPGKFCLFSSLADTPDSMETGQIALLVKTMNILTAWWDTKSNLCILESW